MLGIGLPALLPEDPPGAVGLPAGDAIALLRLAADRDTLLELSAVLASGRCAVADRRDCQGQGCCYLQYQLRPGTVRRGSDRLGPIPEVKAKPRFPSGRRFPLIWLVAINVRVVPPLIGRRAQILDLTASPFT